MKSTTMMALMWIIGIVTVGITIAVSVASFFIAVPVIIGAIIFLSVSSKKLSN